MRLNVDSSSTGEDEYLTLAEVNAEQQRAAVGHAFDEEIMGFGDDVDENGEFKF